MKARSLRRFLLLEVAYALLCIPAAMLSSLGSLSLAVVHITQAAACIAILATATLYIATRKWGEGASQAARSEPKWALPFAFIVAGIILGLFLLGFGVVVFATVLLNSD